MTTRRLLNRVRNALRQWLECRTKQCTYYRHYLAYGPADLTHDGYHAAEWHCEQAQKRVTDWYDAHPDSDRSPESLERIASSWEARVRA